MVLRGTFIYTYIKKINMDNTKEYILCAAIKRLEPRQDTTMYYNNDICSIEIGYRHHDIIRRFQSQLHPPKGGRLSKEYYPLTRHVDKCSY